MGRSPAKEKEKKKGTSLFLPFPVARTHRISSNDPLNHASPPRERGSNLLSSLYLVLTCPWVTRRKHPLNMAQGPRLLFIEENGGSSLFLKKGEREGFAPISLSFTERGVALGSII
jgi:hypothetical protein